MNYNLRVAAAQAAAGDGSLANDLGSYAYVPEHRYVPKDIAVVGRDRSVYVNGVDARNAETNGHHSIDPVTLLAAASDAYAQSHRHEYAKAREWVAMKLAR